MGQAPDGTSYNGLGNGLPLIAGAGDFGPHTPSPKKFTSQPTKVSNPGDIILCIRATIGDLNWSDKTYCLGRGVAGLRPDPNELDGNYLWHFIGANKKKLEALGTGSTFKQISRSDIVNFEIPLPPLDEQRRIAAILDKAEAIRRKRQESIRLTEEFLRSTFLEMFGDPVTNPKGWDSVKLEHICSKITDGTHKTPSYVESGVTFISAKNIKKYRLDWNDVKYITREEHEFLTNRCKAEFGDILLSKSGSIGAAAKVRVNFEFSLFESLALIKYIRNKVNGDYLQHYLNSDHMKRRYVSDTKGLAIRHLHLNEIRNIDVLLPPINLQNQFTEIIDTVESTSTKQVSTNSILNELFESLTHRAFHGEL
jgi:type I restriction enzyme S subunit